VSHRLPTRPGSSRAAWVALVLACACAARPTPPPAEPNRSDARHFLSSQLVADFDQLWAFVRDHYCFFGEKRVAWERVRDRYRPQVIGATDGVAFLRVVNAVLDELYDPHTHAKMHLDGDRRLPGHDLWAELRDGRALIVDVRRPSRAHEAGVRAGDEVLAVDGVAVAEAIAARRPTTLTAPDPEADAWALRSVLSGRHGAARALRLRGSDGATRDVPIPTGGPQSEGETLVARTLDGNVGYIAIRSFGERDLVERFDRALEGMRATTGLVIDVRNNGGGNTAYARPIMGRFIESRMQYAWMTRRTSTRAGRGRTRSPWWCW
jgi:carboxyl-terminal processing protease